jgi:hypothetical protein
MVQRSVSQSTSLHSIFMPGRGKTSPGGRLPVSVELLLGARVFAFLEQVLGLVALAPRVGERERAILAVAVRADGVDFCDGSGSGSPSATVAALPGLLLSGVTKR